jgi:hypothetical protein
MNSNVHTLANAPVRERVSAEEWEVRVNLAACYRLAAHFRMTDLIYRTSRRACPVPPSFPDQWLGLLWDEISASTLVKVTLDGEIVDDPGGRGINRASYVIHSAVHRRVPMRVRHAHTHCGRNRSFRAGSRVASAFAARDALLEQHRLSRLRRSRARAR